MEGARLTQEPEFTDFELYSLVNMYLNLKNVKGL